MLSSNQSGINEAIDTRKQVTGILEKVAIGTLTLCLTFMWNYVQTIEQRLFEMQQDRFTSEDAKELKEDVRKQIEASTAAMNNKLDTILILIKNKQE